MGIKTKAALAAAPDAMKRPAALSAGQPPKFDNDHRAFHGNLRRPCTDTGQQIRGRLDWRPSAFTFPGQGSYHLLAGVDRARLFGGSNGELVSLKFEEPNLRRARQNLIPR